MMNQVTNQALHVIFFGTHQFAATILQSLIESPLIRVDLVITQPDRPVGRNQETTPLPVKQVALRFGLPIDQPSSLKNYTLAPHNSELAIVAQYGLIIPGSILELFPMGVINVHTSLLPKYRGASPIQSALIHGEVETGITIMKMDAGMDTGPILLQKKIPIGKNETYPEIEATLALLGSTALLEVLPRYISRKLNPQPQNETLATYCRPLTRHDGEIDWKKSNQEIYNLYRGLTPWPGVSTTWRGLRLKLLDISPVETTLQTGHVKNTGTSLLIGCGVGSIEVRRLQLEGKKNVRSAEFMNGFPAFADSILPS